MIERADLVLAAIALLATSGLAVRSFIATTGVGTGLLVAPLAPMGYVAAFALIVRELVAGPVAERSGGESS